MSLRDKIRRSLKGFTLMELLLSTGIIAVISTVVILTVDPAELVKRARDSRRLAEIDAIAKAVDIYGAQSGVKYGVASTTYLSLPSSNATTSAGDDCSGMGLPSLPAGYTYHCAASSTYTAVDGTGWIPINFNSLAVGSPFGQLPVDPVNTTSSGYFYTFNVGSYQVTAALESKFFSPTGKNPVGARDSGKFDTRYERGTDLMLLPIDPSNPAVSAPGVPGTPSFASITASSVQINWASAAGAALYKLERSTDGTNFTQIGTSVGASFSDSGLVASTTYYYRVRANNAVGDSAYSASSSFTTSIISVNTAPNTPSQDSPLANATGVSSTPTFYMTATDPESDILKYKVTIYTNSICTATSSVNDQTATTTGWSASSYASGAQANFTLQAPLTASTTYYWKVSVIDSSGSNTWTDSATCNGFTTGVAIANSAPGAPSQDSPLSNATSVSVTPAFYMTATDPESDTLKYKVTIYSNSICTNAAQTIDQTATTTGWSASSYASGAQANYVLQAPLTASTTYYWRASAIDTAGSNTWTDSITCNSFTTGALPTAPGTPSYADIATSSLTVSWTVATSATTYKLERSTSGTAFAQIANPTSTSYGDSGLVASTTYYYRVRASNATGNGPYSASSSVTTAIANSAPGAPSQDSPLANATGVSVTPTFYMTATDPESDTLKYKVTVYTNSICTATSSVNDQTVSATGWSAASYASGATANYTLQSSLSGNVSYYWKASVIDPAGSNTWVDSVTCNGFTTAAPVAGSTGSLMPGVWTTDGIVYAIAVSGTKAYIGGTFGGFYSFTGSGIILDYDSGGLRSASPVVDGIINVAISDGSGGWYIGGSFTSVNNASQKNIAHILSDGSLDSAWQPNASGTVSALAITGSTIYVGGSFTTIGGQARNSIAEIDRTTALATNWNPNASGTVSSLALATSTIYVGGTFTVIGGQARNRIAEIEKSTGNATAWNPNSNNSVRAISIATSTLYIGGTFTNIGGNTRNYIAEVDKVTASSTSWNPNSGSNVYALAVSTSSIYVGGSFTTIGGKTRKYIAEIDLQSGAANLWNPAASNYVNAISLSTPTNSLYMGGAFTTVGSQTRSYLAQIDLSTGSSTAWSPNPNYIVNTLAPSAPGLFAGGQFTYLASSQKIIRTNIAQIDLITGQPTDWNASSSGQVSAITLATSTLYVGGSFTTIGGQTRRNIAEIDIATGVATAWNASSSAAVSALALSTSTLYVGGSFTTIGGQARNNIAELDLVTGSATAWNASSSAAVSALALSTSTLYVGGSFTTIGGQTRRNIAEIDIATGVATAWNASSSAAVSALGLSASSVYVGGSFTTIGGQTRNRIAEIDRTTAAATTWNPNASAAVNTLVVSGSSIYAGGSFTTMGGQAAINIARLDATTGSSTLSLLPAAIVSNCGYALGVGSSDSYVASGGCGNVNGYRNFIVYNLGLGGLVNAPGSAGTPLLSSINYSSIAVSWSAASGAGYYKLERSVDGSNYTQIATPSSTAYSDSGLVANTTYYYRVRASNGGGDGSYGAAASITTPSNISNTKPNSPSQDSPLSGALVGTPTPAFYMTATDPEGDTLKYKVTIYSNSICTNVVQTNDQTVSTAGWSAASYASGVQANFTVQTSLNASTTYYWRASAIDTAGSNTWTDSATCNNFTTPSLPSAPGTPKYSGMVGSSVVVSWTAATSAISYKLERSVDGVSFTQIIATTSLAYTDSGLATSTTYYYRVRATNVAGDGPYSATSTLATMANLPPGNPSQDSPLAGTTAGSLAPTFYMTATDPEGDTLKYKVTIYSNSICTNVVQTNDQTVSTAGWSAASYASGVQAVYALQSALNASTTYYWRASAIDTAGSNTWTDSATCNNFTVAFGTVPVLMAGVWTTDGPINAIVATGSTAFIGGLFNKVGPYTGGGAIVDRATGAVSANSFYVDGMVNVAVPDVSGGWYIGGAFSRVSNVARNNIAHILSDGTLDIAWNPNTNATGTVSALARSTSTLYVGGSFTTIGGQTRRNIAEVDLATGSATSWNASSSAVVSALALSTSTLYVGGSFTTIGGQTRRNIAEVDLATGSATSWNASSSGSVTSLVLSTSTLYAGGSFVTIGGLTRQSIAELSLATASATAWVTSLNGIVSSTALSTSTIYVAGTFTTAYGQARTGLAEISLITGSSTSWDPNTVSTPSSLALATSTIYVGGQFATVNSVARPYAAELDLKTTNPTQWKPNPNSTVNFIAVSTSSVFIGGQFNMAGPWVYRSNIAQIDLVSGKATDWNPGASSSISALALSTSTIYAGGGFTTIGGQSRRYIAELDRTTGNATTWSPSSSASVFALALSTSTIYAGGSFTSIGGQTRNRIAEIDLTTGSSTSWNASSSGIVYALALSTSTLYAGGLLTVIGGQSRNYIAELNLATATATAWNPAANATVNALVLSTSTIYAGGNFTSVGGQARNYIAELNLTNATATAWNPNAQNPATAPYIYALTRTPSAIFAGGLFTSIGGNAALGFASLDPKTGSSTPIYPATTSTVSMSLGLFNTKILVGGNQSGSYIRYLNVFDLGN